MPYTPPAALSQTAASPVLHRPQSLQPAPQAQPEMLPPALHPQSPPSSVLYLHGFLSKRPPAPKLSESRAEFLTADGPEKPRQVELPSQQNGAGALFPSHSMVDLRESESASVSSAVISEAEVDSDDDRPPRMVRKKSGELVKPSLKSRRPSSVPSTPTFPKNVHFDTHLEHVRHFLQAERPTAVSNPGSPVDETELYFPPWRPEDDSPEPDRVPSPFSIYDWEILLPNFPSRYIPPLDSMVFTERVFLAPDQRSLIGHVAVRNVAFSKWVAVKFTVDYWKTVSEVAADFSDPIASALPHPPAGYDRFTFSIKLGDFSKLEQKTLFFCVRYSVNGAEYWDNNGGANFQVKFRRKHKQHQPARISFERRLSDSDIDIPLSFLSSPSPAFYKPPPRPAMQDYSFESSYTLPVVSLSSTSAGLTSSDGGSSAINSSSSGGPNTMSKIKSTSRSTTPPEIVPPAGRPFTSRYDFRASLNAVLSASSTSSSSSTTQNSSSNPSSSSSQETIVPTQRQARATFAFGGGRFRSVNASLGAGESNSNSYNNSNSETPPLEATGSPTKYISSSSSSSSYPYSSGILEPTATAVNNGGSRGLTFGPSSEDLKHVNEQLASLRVDRERNRRSQQSPAQSEQSEQSEQQQQKQQQYYDPSQIVKEKPAIDSTSYQVFLDNFCFFQGPQKPGKQSASTSPVATTHSSSVTSPDMSVAGIPTTSTSLYGRLPAPIDTAIEEGDMRSSSSSSAARFYVGRSHSPSPTESDSPFDSPVKMVENVEDVRTTTTTAHIKFTTTTAASNNAAGTATAASRI
ncbi:putative phosphatase regulatory subunit-domain-containing protein [Myxozyma melibiosi]|uniref:Phosphatase regulatory subunit-domain-containing protein n=1 Tax=Myxozyma melibiosi TaxID=54550 RepID=A0ABR1F003_9ASCO